jgi:hypothetical protein
MADATMPRLPEDLRTEVLVAAQALVVRRHPLAAKRPFSLPFLRAAQSILPYVAFPVLQ